MHAQTAELIAQRQSVVEAADKRSAEFAKELVNS